jgi:hypothetical protein
MLVPPENAVAKRHVKIFLCDLLICSWLWGWAEVKMFCVVLCSYNGVCSWSSFVKGQFYEICCRFGDVMILRRLKWDHDVFYVCVIFWCWFLVIMLWSPRLFWDLLQMLWCVDPLGIWVIGWYCVLFPAVMVMVACDSDSDSALIPGDFVRSLRDVVIWDCWADWSELMILCVAIRIYDVIFS